VTGATGVVGHETLVQARLAGWDAVGCSRRGGPGIIQWNLADEPPAELRRPWDAMVHCAARPRWNLPAHEAWQANAAPVEVVASLVGPDTSFILISTAYASGLTGSVESNDLDDYRNTYEWSKAGAERLVAERIGACTVIRPPLVVGRRAEGSVARFTGLYSFLGALTSSQLPALVADPQGRLDIVSTSDIADLCLAEIDRGQPPSGVLTMGAGNQTMDNRATMELIERRINRWRAHAGLAPLEWPPFISPEAWERLYRPMARRAFTDRQLRILDLLEPFIPYLSMAQPLAANHLVAPMADCLERCVDYWLETHPAAARRELKPWSVGSRAVSNG
jgi:nucleoside-diphosphate-sugar epimerase